MEFLPNFKLYRPDNVKDAVKLATEQTRARYVAGGTDIVVNVRRGIEQPQSLVDLTPITEIQEIIEVDATKITQLGMPSRQHTSNVKCCSFGPQLFFRHCRPSLVAHDVAPILR